MALQQVNKLPFEGLIADARSHKLGNWHSKLSERALELYTETGWPGPKTESWKYTSLNKLASGTFTLAEEYSAVVPEDMIMPLTGPRLVLVNGVLNKELSNLKQLTGSLSITSLVDLEDHQKIPFDDLFKKEESKEYLPLTYLNTAIPVSYTHLTLPTKA